MRPGPQHLCRDCQLEAEVPENYEGDFELKMMTTLTYPDDTATIGLDGTKNEASVEVSGAGRSIRIHGYNWPTNRGAIHVRLNGTDLAIVEPPMQTWKRVLDLPVQVDQAIIQAVVLEEPHIPKPKPKPKPAPALAHPPPSGNTFCFLRGEDPIPGIQWIPSANSFVTFVLYCPRSGLVACRTGIPKVAARTWPALWRELYEISKKREPRLSDEDHVVRPVLTHYTMVLRDFHSGIFPYNIEGATRNLRGCIKRLKSLGALPDDYKTVIKEDREGSPHLAIKIKAADW